MYIQVALTVFPGQSFSVSVVSNPAIVFLLPNEAFPTNPVRPWVDIWLEEKQGKKMVAHAESNAETLRRWIGLYEKDIETIEKNYQLIRVNLASMEDEMQFYEPFYESLFA